MADLGVFAAGVERGANRSREYGELLAPRLLQLRPDGVGRCHAIAELEEVVKTQQEQIEEMTKALKQVERTTNGLVRGAKALGTAADTSRENGFEWAGANPKAKAALLEKSKLSETAGLLGEELVRVEEAIARGDADIAKLQAKLAEAKAKQKAILARQETAGTRLKVRQTLHDSRVDDALARFEQIERKLDEAEGRVEAFDLGQRKSLADEIAALEAESAIDAELEALKQRLASRDDRLAREIRSKLANNLEENRLLRRLLKLAEQQERITRATDAD